ncbi:DUF2306 domain-containing protein [Pseudomonas sp. CGJS7]|uniref:DUF2306 domain-containing protein n=1 Tax=Pseudomonas sp. CGJS7 TaxID=3109348 RepID=UPI00300BB325
MPPTVSAVDAAPLSPSLAGARALRWSARAWIAVAAVGQLFFAGYIAAYYGGAAAHGRWQDWNRIFAHGHVAGDGYGNALVAAHLAFAVLTILAGLAQLSPALRARWPRLHRWNGRFYLGAAAVMSLGGLSMIAHRGSVGDASQKVGIVLNALLILIFAWQALRHARARRFDLHRRWALRLYLAMAGVWFFRVGLMLWVVINQGPAGFDPASFTGPFLTALAFAQYLLPLAMLELYLRAQARANAIQRGAVAAALAVATLATAGGVAAAIALMWLPRLQ